jgi:SAM-dependent methyltransferase
LDWDGKYTREGFYAQAEIVERLAKETSAKRVLEVGPGKGFNSVHLAKRNPSIEFSGIDLTPLHVRLASDSGQGVPNLRFIQGNFHRMPELGDGSFDLAFDVEAICYSDTSEKLDQLFSEVHRVLGPRGLFTSFNYVLSDEADRAPEHARLAVRLVERAWVIDHFHREADWNAAARRAGFRVLERRDLRDAALPSITRLYRQARMFYLSMATPLRPILTPLLRRSTHNAVSALMLPYTFGLGALEYRQVILQRAD